MKVYEIFFSFIAYNRIDKPKYQMRQCSTCAVCTLRFDFYIFRLVRDRIKI